jgi:hypothetical protein
VPQLRQERQFLVIAISYQSRSKGIRWRNCRQPLAHPSRIALATNARNCGNQQQKAERMQQRDEHADEEQGCVVLILAIIADVSYQDALGLQIDA